MGGNQGAEVWGVLGYKASRFRGHLAKKSSLIQLKKQPKISRNLYRIMIVMLNKGNN